MASTGPIGTEIEVAHQVACRCRARRPLARNGQQPLGTLVISVPAGDRALHQERLGAQRLFRGELLQPSQRLLVGRAALRRGLADITHDIGGKHRGVARPQGFLSIGRGAAEINDSGPRDLRR